MKEPKWILVLGPRGTYGDQIALEHIAKNGLCSDGMWVVKYCKSHEELLRIFCRGEGHLAVVAATNVQGGRVNDVTEFWLANDTSSMIAVKAFRASIQHCLAAKKDAGPLGIMEAISHPQALRQCETSLHKRGILRGDVVVSTAEAARLISSEPPGLRRGAVCSSFAARIYGLDVIAENLSDLGDDNITTFQVLARPGTVVDCGEEKRTEVLFGLVHEPKALLKALEVFGEVNLHDIQSYWWRKDIQTNRELTFQLIFPSSDADEDLIQRLREQTTWLKVVGSYPTVDVVL